MKSLSMFFRVVALAAVVMLAAPMVVHAATAQDQALEQSVKAKLKEGKNYDATDVTVTVENGVVTLRGPVRRNHEVKAMQDAVETMPGVTSVNNQLKVNNTSN